MAEAHADTTAIILAAGKGTRMGSDLAKVMHPLAGRPMISHVLETCRALGVGQTVVVVGWQRELVEAVARPFGADCALQDRQLGTGHAVRAAEALVRGRTVLALYGDCPLVPAALLETLLATHRGRGAACTAVAARLRDPGAYGRMVTDAGGRLVRIVEHKDASDSERGITLINSGIYAFDRAALFAALAELRPANAQGEYYITDVVGIFTRAGRVVEMIVTDDASAVLGVNTPAELAAAEASYRARG